MWSGDIVKKNALEAQESQKKVTFAIMEGANSPSWIAKSSRALKIQEWRMSLDKTSTDKVLGILIPTRRLSGSMETEQASCSHDDCDGEWEAF
jgi:hypothetical protein